MIHISNKKRESLIRWKVYFDRSRMYIGYVQFFLIVFVFLRSFKDNYYGDLFFKYALISIPIFFLIFIISVIFIGYLDLKLGLREEEFKNLSKSNPVTMDILETIKSMEKELQEIKMQLKKDL